MGKNGFGVDPQWCSKMLVTEILVIDGSMAYSLGLGYGVSLVCFLERTEPDKHESLLRLWPLDCV